MVRLWRWGLFSWGQLEFEYRCVPKPLPPPDRRPASRAGSGAVGRLPPEVPESVASRLFKLAVKFGTLLRLPTSAATVHLTVWMPREGAAMNRVLQTIPELSFKPVYETILNMQPAPPDDPTRERISGERLDLPLLGHVGLVRSHGASRISWHRHQGFELLFVVGGATAYEFHGGRVIELHGGHFLVVPPRMAHRGVHEVRSPATICGLLLNPPRRGQNRNTSFTPQDLRRLRGLLQGAAFAVRPFNPTLRWLVKRLTDEAAAFWSNPADVNTQAGLRTTLCATLLEAMRQMLAPPIAPKAIVAAAVAYLRQHHNRSVAISELVSHLGYSRPRVFQLFKAETGLTPNDYLQRVRIEKVQELLAQTGRSITDIAAATGFNSGQYLSTVFRKYTGSSPIGYRHAAGRGAVPALRPGIKKP